MSSNKGKRTFVLVHGAWHGGWSWKRVAEPLRQAGHIVFTPTLTGLADRSHLLSGSINLDTHINDVANVFKWEDIDDAILVGHSYAGWVISGALEHIEDRVAGVVYLDAFVPDNGLRSYDLTHGENRTSLDRALADGDISRPVPSGQRLGLTDPDDIAWVERKLTPQPIGVSMQPITLTGARERIPRKLYIRATRYEQPAFDAAFDKCSADPSWQAIGMDNCSHDIMVDAAPELVDILQKFANT